MKITYITFSSLVLQGFQMHTSHFCIYIVHLQLNLLDKFLKCGKRITEELFSIIDELK